jgi:hypothetical protein
MTLCGFENLHVMPKMQSIHYIHVKCTCHVAMQPSETGTMQPSESGTMQLSESGTAPSMVIIQLSEEGSTGTCSDDIQLSRVDSYPCMVITRPDPQQSNVEIFREKYCCKSPCGIHAFLCYGLLLSNLAIWGGYLIFRFQNSI